MKNRILVIIIFCLFLNCSEKVEVIDDPKGSIRLEVYSDKPGIFITYTVNGLSKQISVNENMWALNDESFKGEFVGLQASASGFSEANLSGKIIWRGRVFRSASDSGQSANFLIGGLLN